jgi:microcystin-dependent protein
MADVDAFIGEIGIFPYNYIPAGWLECNGQSVPRRQFPMLFSVIGTIYGGDPTGTTFALPNLTGRAAMGAGQGAGLTMRALGTVWGQEDVALTPAQTSHNHPLINKGAVNPGVDKTSVPQATSTIGGIGILPAGGGPPVGANSVIPGGAPDTIMHPQSISVAGLHSAEPHDNSQPYLILSYCICVDGEFPTPA